MRPPAIEKMGYYETSINVAQLLKTYFKPADSGRLLDPCAGEGTAASILAKALNCQSWGAELSPARAALAAEKMDRLFNTPWSSCHLTSESITLLFLNPPYSHDRLGDQKRLELEFLKSTTPKLVRGGVLVYIVPHPLLRDLDVASHLAGYYENIRIYRYPDTGFNQVIVLATKRVKYKIPSHEEVHQVQAWADVEPPMLVEVDEPLYELLPATDKGSGGQPIRFSRLDWQPEEIVDATQKRGLHSSKDWLDLLNPSRGLGELKQPVMPLKKGHIAMLMASGMMGMLRLTDEDGKPMLVKGRVVKVTEKIEENTDKKGNVTSEVFRDRFVSTVAILRQSGIEIINTVDPLSKFMHKYGDQIGAHILSTYRPLYNFDPTPEEAAILDTLGTNRKPLPGQEKPGLLPAQRHVATALSRAIQLHHVGNLQKEMGSGGTIMSIGAMELLDAYPAIVLCPPHLVPKWIREIEETIPCAKAMEITRIGRNADDPGDVNDVRRFLQLCKSGELGKKPVAVIAHTSAKYGAGWEHAVARKKFVDDEDGRVFEALCCPTCGSPIKIDLPGGFVKIANTLDDLGDKRHFCKAEIPGYELDERKQLKRDEQGSPVWGRRICGAPLFQFTGRRWAIADYIAKHAREQFKMLVADECLVRNTMIETSEGAKPIQDIRVGDYVLSFNHTTNKTEYRQVLHAMKNPAPKKLLKVAGIVCTPNHPIFTKEEDYVEAQKIGGKTLYILRKEIHDLPQRSGDRKILFKVLCLSESRPGNRQTSRRKAAQANGEKELPSVWKDLFPETNGAIIGPTKVLLKEVQCSIPVPRSQSSAHVCAKDVACWKWTERNQAPGSCRKNEKKESNVHPGGEGKSKTGKDRQNIPFTRRQRKIYSATSNIVPSSWIAGVRNGIRNTHGQSKGPLSILTSSLQSGYWNTRGKTGNRSRWTNPHIQEMEISGPPQNGSFEFSRVGGVEILEQGSGQGFGKVCPDGYVYNFEVEGNNNYFANGVLVHNCHQFKSKSSDRGIAFHQLVEATKYTLTLTGTFFGGKSTSIFWLLHRLNAGVRKDFAFNDEKRWARLYGVLEMTRKSKRTEEDGDEDGFTGNRRYQNQAKEQPGISPAIVNRLLDTTVFLSLKDLGLALPHYAEEVVTLEMTDEQSSQYRVMAKKLYDLAIKSRRYLSTWLQWTLARPNSAFRDEVVEVDEVNKKGEVIRRKELMELPAVVDKEALPKESWLVDFCRAERQQGRKVLIYLRQTGTRDIQDRILKTLRDGGVRAEVLTSSVNPRKREEWIAKRVVGLDALVVNPRLVETGLDLVAFSSVVFAEIEYSLYTLWQAVRRVWRLGQTKPVKAIFSVYSEAMEARALALMGRKMKAAQLLYGDEVGGAIVEEDEGDILMKLAREALESADLPDLQSLFADEAVVSNSPMGCPTVPSATLPVPEMPKVVSWSDWMIQRGVVGRSSSRSRSKQAIQNQVYLF
ncbi:MAG: hypothetical protein KPEEDBHJ_03372 [Anaerolineales bacterium]|nr:hypothetical protein [Anaerolineales bacterium]